MATQEQPSQETTKKNSNISEIDLSQLSLPELMDLRDRVEHELAQAQLYRLGQYDIALEYVLNAYTKGGCFHTASGVVSLPAIFHPRLVPTSISKLEDALTVQLYEPLRAEFQDISDRVNNGETQPIKLLDNTSPGGVFSN